MKENHKNILLVGDSERIQQWKAELEGHGYRCTNASTIAAALACLKGYQRNDISPPALLVQEDVTSYSDAAQNGLPDDFRTAASHLGVQ